MINEIRTGYEIQGQIHLLRIVMGMNLWQCIQLTYDDLVRCAQDNLKSRLFETVRQSDIDQFIKQIEENWELIITPKISGGCTLKRIDRISYKQNPYIS